MEALQNKKQIKKLIIIFTFTYMISYVTRINYGAVILEMQYATQISKSLLSMALTGSFITYGVGQIISGICGDKISPKKLMSLGLACTVLMNCLIPICSNAYQMLIVWCLNGFAQAFMWPPLVRIMAVLLTEDDYKLATVRVTWGSSFGTIAVYLISPLIISFLSWKWVFIFSAICGAVMLLIWNMYAIDIPKESKKEKSNTIPIYKIITPVILGVMLVIILQGMLRDGVTTWMPSYISDIYNFSNEVSILSGVILPLFSILSLEIAAWLYRKIFKNPLMCSAMIFATGTFAAFALVILTGKNAIFSIFSCALLTSCMHGVNLMLIGMLPAFFKKTGCVSTVSGLLNACTYIGSAISTYGIAVISENFGWNSTLLIWLFIAILGTTICFICAKFWKYSY